MVRWLSRFFNYLDRYYIQRHNLHPLNDVGLLVFRGEPAGYGAGRLGREGAGAPAGAGTAARCPAAGRPGMRLLTCCFIPRTTTLVPVTPGSQCFLALPTSSSFLNPTPTSFPPPPDHVYVEIRRAAKDAMLRLVEAEREGEQVDKALLKNVLAIFQEARLQFVFGLFVVVFWELLGRALPPVAHHSVASPVRSIPRALPQAVGQPPVEGAARQP